MEGQLEFRYRKLEKIPTLSWLAELRLNATTVEVIHGPGVETRPQFFFKGAWSGAFEQGAFINEVAFGSGAIVEPDGVVFSTPDHLLERLYIHRRDDRVLVSNSLACVLCKLEDGLDPTFDGYHEALGQITRGLKHHHTSLPTAKGQKIEVIYWNNFRFDAQLNLSILEKNHNAAFDDYESYKSYLLETMRRLFENANDAGRAQSYQPLSTISSGYDSTAIATLAAALGHHQAVTFSQSRDGEDDSGKAVGEALNLQIEQYDRLGYLQAEDWPEVETQGVSSEKSSLRACLPGRLLLTGYMGDSVWERDLMHPSRDLIWPLSAANNLTEMRLRVGFIHAPIPFIAGREIPRIHRITCSPEMKPWTLYNSYDRPICRRIAEEAGVPREAFGQRKKAAGVFYAIEGLKNTMTPEAYADYLQYKQRYHQPPSLMNQKWRNLKAKLFARNRSLQSRVFKATAVRLGYGVRLPILVAKTNPYNEGTLLFQWSTQQVQKRYQTEVADDM